MGGGRCCWPRWSPTRWALTALRVVAPAGGGRRGVVAADGVAVVSWPWVGAVPRVAFAPAIGVACVNGPAYPNERRFLLRPPGPLLAGPLPLAWAAGGGAGRWRACCCWPPGSGWSAAPLLVVGAPVAVVLARSLHSLSRRWVVFVPAGVVLHDPSTLADPVLFRGRRWHRRCDRPPADTDSLDLTQRAPGLAIELLLREKVPITLVQPGRRGGEPGTPARLLFTPTRPGAVLAEARSAAWPNGREALGRSRSRGMQGLHGIGPRTVGG